jgi:T-complex protein 1 subunit alpha
VKFIKEKLIVPVDQLKHENLMNAAKTSMSSKILGSESDFFADLAVRAVLSVKTESEGDGGKKTARYPVRCVASCRGCVASGGGGGPHLGHR